MINQYTIPLSTKGNIVSKIIFSLINAPALNIALDLCFVKKKKKKKKLGDEMIKIRFLYQEVLYFNQDFTQLNLKKNSKTKNLYLYSLLC